MAEVKAKVLKLNASYMPIGIVSWKEAITLWCKGIAEIVDEYDDIQLHSWKSAMNCPAVIRLRTFSKPDKKLTFYLPFTRKNIYDRDNHKCQYCGKNVSLKKMTFDHVIPKAQNGMTNWRNIVCACWKCNAKKAARTPQEANMKLIQKPYAPIIANSFADGMRKRMIKSLKMLNNEKWRAWVYMNVELEQDK